MARFRIRGNDFDWLDCMEYDMFIRSEAGDWSPLEPDKFSVRGVYGYRWYDIDDAFDPRFDDPCSNIETGECGGGPTSLVKGSGDGFGSQGALFDPIKGYPPGFDLPDAGRTGFGERIVNASPAGRAIRRPGIKLIESYDPVGHASRSGLGTWENPNRPYESVHSRGAVITETIYAMPPYGGYIELLFTSYQEAGISVDVYHMGARVASTCGKVGGRSRIKFEFDSSQEDLRLMVRVRANQGSNWTLQILPPSLATPPDRGNLPLDHQASYNVIGFPDVINPRYIGTPIFPAPCHATVWPIAERILESNAFEYYHYVGTESGWMYVDYSSWENLDFIEVYHAGKRIATTLDAQPDRGHLRFFYDPRNTLNYDLMVRVVASDFGENDSLKSVYYSMYCPTERGSRAYRHPCETYNIYSAGHPFTEDNFQLIRHTDMRAILVQVDSGSFKTFFELFDGDHIHGVEHRLDTETVEGRGTLEAWFTPEPEHDNRAQTAVRATSAIGCDWQYFAYCPIQPPKIMIPDYLIPYRCIEGTDVQVESTPGFRPPFVLGPTDWTLVAESKAGINILKFPWKYGHEYYIVTRNGSNYYIRNFFTQKSVVGPTVAPSAIFLDGRYPLCQVGFGAPNLADTSTAGRWAGINGPSGVIHLIFERPYSVSLTEEGKKHTNSWRTLPVNHQWEYGYEYVVFSYDAPGGVEVSQQRVIVPYKTHEGERPAGDYFLDATNSTIVKIKNDGTVTSEYSTTGTKSILGIMRRPLYLDDGSGDTMLWRREHYNAKRASGPAPVRWDYGREVFLNTFQSGNFDSNSNHAIIAPLHLLEYKLGRFGGTPSVGAWPGDIYSTSVGEGLLRGGLSKKGSRTAAGIGSNLGTWQSYSRPFKYKEQFDLLEKYLDLANLLE